MPSLEFRGARKRTPLVMSLLLATPLVAQAATMIVVNADGPGEGLNDQTPFVAQGGNTAITLGEARLRAVQFAASLVGNAIDSPLPIRIAVQFNPMGTTGTPVRLGRGGPSFFHDFPGAPRPGTWYPAPLANKLAGVDLDPAEEEISLFLNVDVDGPVAFGPNKFYYGFDAAAPAGDPSLVTVAVHELLHGLGFTTLLDETSGAEPEGLDDVFELHLERTGATPPDFPSMTDAQRLAAFTAAPAIHWVGPNTAAMSSLLTAGVTADGKVEMYAPGPTAVDGALIHFNTDLAPFQGMEPSYGGIQLDLQLARAILADLGWGPGPECVTVQTPGPGGAP
jgi:hypothetical protein